MRVDFKETIWYQVDVPEEHEQAILEMMKAGKIDDANDLVCALQELDEFLLGSGEHNLETGEQMSPLENDGQPTIEAFDDDENVLWSNEQKPVKHPKKNQKRK